MRHALQALARDFAQVAVPSEGRYVEVPVHADEHGTISVPPPQD
jgi:hypothetical protein